MSVASRKKPEPPVGVIGALVSGFETVNARLELILLPLVLDLFLWLGPHLSVRAVIEGLLDLMRLPSGVDAATARNLEVWRRLLSEYGQSFNLFSVLSTAPVGLPSLMAGRAPNVMPGGQPVIWVVGNPLVYLVLFGAFALAGLFLGALYFGGIAQQVRDARLDLRKLVRSVWGDWLRLIALVAIWLFLLAFFGIPMALLAGLLALISPVVGSLFSLLGSMLGLWALIYMGFALHGIILQRRGLFGALWDSIRLVHRNLPPTASLYAVIFLLGAGLSLLWNIPADGTWLLLIGVAGHAIVSTALVAATFVFYKDRYRQWMEARTADGRWQMAGGR
ncbi:MAG TPA: hypothetical protein VI793_03230 [Anaerolineales bacterium]|nr:hypothetical protein [Anaerolineales bacterium]